MENKDYPGYRWHVQFTAQGRTVASLMRMYGALETQPDLKFDPLPIVVFMAFSIEAYLNSIGSRKVAFWDQIERLAWRQKVVILHKVAGCHPDWGAEPLQFAAEIFKLRDKLAHGQPEDVVGDITRDPIKLDDQLNPADHLEPIWFQSMNRDWVLAAKERYRVLMRYLGAMHGYHESDHLQRSSARAVAVAPDTEPTRRAAKL